jgi:hypothetical protein
MEKILRFNENLKCVTSFSTHNNVQYKQGDIINMSSFNALLDWEKNFFKSESEYGEIIHKRVHKSKISDGNDNDGKHLTGTNPGDGFGTGIPGGIDIDFDTIL